MLTASQLLYWFTFLLVPMLGMSQSITRYKNWLVGGDVQTRLLIPADKQTPITRLRQHPIVHVRFQVKEYGEVSCALNALTQPGQEAQPVDLHRSRYVKITYKANAPVLFQVREYNIHGGIQNHVILPASKKWRTARIRFSAFQGGLSPLNLQNVAKFNFAFLASHPTEGFADLRLKSVNIHRYHP